VVVIDAYGGYTFRSVINEVIQKGFKAALKEDTKGDEEEQEVGQFDEKSCAILKLEILNKKTSPQKEFSQVPCLPLWKIPGAKRK
jgi:DNA topoisomerase IA